MNRPDGDPARPYTVAPGAYDFAPPIPPLSRGGTHGRPGGQASPEARAPHPGSYQVVWWDPHLLRLHAASSFGLGRDDLIVKDGDMFAVEERLADYERWRDSRERTVEQAKTPSLRVQTATSWAVEASVHGIDTEIAAASDVQIVEIASGHRRPRGPRFGTLVHAVLATVALDAADDVVRRTAAAQGRILLASQEEGNAAAAVVSAVLRHELIARARDATAVRRETPVTWLQKDGTLVEGVLDLAFDEHAATVVVDFKTDQELAASESRYRAQVQQYVTAVSRATGRPTSGVLFRV
jgi:ATP-dependent exoDNAse (exonuclease V) beta subunit